MTTCQKIKKSIIPILKKHQVKRASIFGSFARGEERKNSDVDLLVDFKKEVGLFAFVNLKNSLEEKVGRKFDVITFRSVDKKLKPYINKDLVRVF
ncbi:MAG: nucleotidyltransferase family protein [Candidatus Magasanikbacteria bacterium]